MKKSINKKKTFMELTRNHTSVFKKILEYKKYKYRPVCIYDEIQLYFESVSSKY